MIIPESVPTAAALLVGAAGLAAGIAFGRVSVREQLRQIRRLLPTVMNYARKGDEAYALARAIESPTMAVPVVELLADSRGPRERFTDAWRAGMDRARKLANDLRPEPEHVGATAEEGLGLLPAAHPVAEPVTAAADDPGDTLIFQALAAEFYGDSKYTLPARPSPWAQPEIKRTPAGLQRAPKWEVRPAPPRRGSLLGLVAPELPGQRLPNDPRRMAMLDPDDTRAFRTKVVEA